MMVFYYDFVKPLVVNVKLESLILFRNKEY